MPVWTGVSSSDHGVEQAFMPAMLCDKFAGALAAEVNQLAGHSNSETALAG